MKYYLSALLLLCGLSQTIAQNRTSHKWQIGGSVGLMGYWGDLNEDFVTPTQGMLDLRSDLFTYSGFIERLGSNGWGWRIYASNGAFEANDRRINWDGNLETAYPLLGRGLNVQTKIREAGWQLVFRTDNGWLLGKRAFIAPYFAIGAGATHFRPYGDQYYNGNTPYHYWSDGSIRNLAESPSNQTIAQVITQDQEYETALWQYQTEGVDYGNITWHASASVGLSFRLSKRLGLQLEYNARYTGSDYLDDISGNYLVLAPEKNRYLSNPSDWSGSRSTVDKSWFDAYHFASVGLRYRLGEQRTELDLPVIYHNEYAYPTTETVAKNDSMIETPEKPIRTITTYLFPTAGLMAFDEQNQLVAWEADFSFPFEKGASADSKQPSFQVSPVAKTDTAPASDTPKGTEPKGPELSETVSKETATDTTSTVKITETTRVNKEVEINEVVKQEKKVEETPQAVEAKAETSNKGKTGFSVVPSKPKEEKAEKPKKEKKEDKEEPVSISVVPGPIAVEAAATGNDAVDSLKRVTLGQQRQLNDLQAQLYAIQRTMPNYNPTTVTVVPALDSTRTSPANNNTAAGQQINALMRRVEDLEYQLMQLKSGSIAPTAGTNMNEALVMQQLQQMNQQLQQLVQQTLNNQQQMQQAMQRLANSSDRTSPPVVPVTPVVQPVAATPAMAQAFAKTVVFFDVGSSNLSTWSKDRLQAVGLFLNQNPAQKMLIRAYTDQTGSASMNAKLSSARASKVLTFLQQMGVSPSQITLDYTGPDLSLTDKNSSYGRRVELVKP